MGTRARPSQLRIPAEVQQWQAERACRAGRAAGEAGHGRRCVWPADRQAVLEEVLASARTASRPLVLTAPEAPGERL